MIFVSTLALAPNSINLWVGRDVAPGNNVQLVLNTTNIPKVRVEAFPVSASDWLGREHPDEKEFPKPIGPAVKSWEVTVQQPGQLNPASVNYYSRRINLPIQTPGVYLLRVTGGHASASGVVNVTNLAILAKRSPDQLLAWLTDFRTGKTLPGVELTFTNGKKPILGPVKTGSDGVWVGKVPRGASMIVARRGADYAGIVAAPPGSDGELVPSWQTDRPIYRPGQSMQYKCIPRTRKGGGYAQVASEKATVQLLDAHDNPVDSQTVPISPFGTIAGGFDLPKEAMLGAYTLLAKVGQHETRESFLVEAYRKPEFKVESNPAAKHYLSGDKVRFKVHAGYFFGAPLPQAKFKWVVRANGMRDFGDGVQWYRGRDNNLFPSDIYAGSPVIGEGVGSTDGNGDVIVEVPSKAKGNTAQFTLEGMVTDGSRRTVATQASVTVHSANVNLSIRPEVSFVNRRELIPVTLKLSDLDGQPVKGSVLLKTYVVDWDDKKQVWTSKEFSRQAVPISAQGNVRTTVPASVEGNLILEASTEDSTGRTARAQATVWVADYRLPKPETRVTPEINLRTDRSEYQVGNVARTFVGSNQSGHPILVLVEGRTLGAYKVISGPTTLFPVKLDATQSPNVFVSASQWVKSEMVSNSVAIPVKDPSRHIKVSLKSDRTEYRPGEKAIYTVTTTDDHALPRSSELAIGTVDESIYAIQADETTDPHVVYWGVRPNLISTTQSAPEERSAGAFQVAAASPSLLTMKGGFDGRVQAEKPLVRSRFVDTAYWNPVVVTGADGTANFTVDVPDNLTTWRTTARAVTHESAAGTGLSNFVASLPLTFRLATPRVLTAGDQIEVVGTLNNRTALPLSTVVKLDVTGGPARPASSQIVEVPAHGEARVKWLVAAGDPGELTFNGEAAIEPYDGKTGDAVRVSVPVVPNGRLRRVAIGGTVDGTTSVKLEFPAETLSDGASFRVIVKRGLSSERARMIDEVTHLSRYGTPAAANILTALAVAKADPKSESYREALALIVRNQLGMGWGWWQQGQPDPVITAQVIRSLTYAQSRGYAIYPNLLKQSSSILETSYLQSSIWEHRTLFVADMFELNPVLGERHVAELLENQTNVSPFAKLRLIIALSKEHREKARELLQPILPLVSAGTTESFLPVGATLFSTASEVQTTGALLQCLVATDTEPGLARKLANWLGKRQTFGWDSAEDKVETALALDAYLGKHPESQSPVGGTVTVGGKEFPLRLSPVGPFAKSTITGVKAEGEPIFNLQVTGGAAEYEVVSDIYVRAHEESKHGVRVMRRFEQRNAAGVWTEATGPVTAGEPVRVTLAVWGDDIDDAVRVDEPLPAGFEFVDSESTYVGQEEVRDGVVRHYLSNAGTPTVLRYFLRAENSGQVIARPVSVEYLRRPAVNGNTGDEALKVKGDH